MISNSNGVNSENQFFSNNNVPYAVKAGAAAVLLHVTPNYSQDSLKRTTFMGTFFRKDLNTNQRVIDGAISFTFAAESSMGEDNCVASMRKLGEYYPTLGDIFEHIADGKLAMSDAEVCAVLSEAAAKKFEFNQEGSDKNFDNYVANNFDKYIEQVTSHYPGMLHVDVYANLKAAYESSCKKKQIMQSAAQPTA